MVLLPFDLLISLLEKLAELLKTSRNNSLDRFDRLIQPAFEDLTLIHKNYLDMFTHIKLEFSSTRDIKEITRILETDRIELAALRRSTKEVAVVLATQDHLKKYKDFWNAVYNYLQFQEYSNTSLLPTSTASASFLKTLKDPEITKLQKKELTERIVGNIDGYISNIEAKWERVSKEYGKLLGRLY